MAEEQAEIKLLRSQKAKLIEILSTDADFVLQHADSCSLLSRHGYQQVKACRSPSEKVTELLDHILQRGPEAVTGLLKLLNSEPLQETFPLLSFIKDLEVHTVSSGEKETFPVPETMPSKDICNNGYRLVTEKQLMTLARTIGKTWREIGRMALDIPSVKLEQFELDNSHHVEQVFAMLRYWRNRQREKATAASLHSLLSQEDYALPPESIDFLLRD